MPYITPRARSRGAGAYTTRVSVEAETQSVNAQGEVVRTWTEVAKRWAAIEQARNQPTDGGINQTVRMRWDSQLTLTNKHRLTIADTFGAFRILNIKAVFDDGRAHGEWVLSVFEER